MKKIGIIGCGTIGTEIARFIQRAFKNRAKIVAICDIDPQKTDILARKIKPLPIINSIDDVIKRSDLIIESAGVDISGYIAEEAVSHKKDVLIMSTGGLINKHFLFEKARVNRCSIYIPSGAVCGLDGLISSMVGKVRTVSLTTRKPIRGLRGADYFKKKNIDIDKIKKETIIYSGNVRDAIRYFPQNINVSATLSLLGIGPKRTKVKIITSPGYTKNIHEVKVEGEFGRFWTRTENVPSKENPKTSKLAIFSAIAKLKEVV